MKIVLIGADLEENLGVGMIAAVAEAAGHAVSVVPFSDAGERSAVQARVLALAPDVVGLSLQFQHRSAEFLELAAGLRAGGFAGHLALGGQYPTLAWREVLTGGHGVSAIVLHDGEETFRELLGALAAGAPLEGIAGLALPGPDGPLRTAGRPLEGELDRLPFPKRYRPHSRHLGVPFIPIMGGRGCWGRCTFCSIASFYRDARQHGGGKLLRHRSPENIAAEMAQLLRAAGPRAVFCFHDDTFLLPRPEASLARVRALRAALEREGVTGQIGLIGKCRPDSLTRELAGQLRALGVVRLYLGVENTSRPGLIHLGRDVELEQVREALSACSEAGIFVCYNLLVFEPDATLDDLAANLAFVKEHPEHPVNFGRAEPYHGTPLQQRLAAEGNLSGSYLGNGYRVKDDRTELLFRICAAVFRQRNYDADGVHNRVMGIGYLARLLEHFHGQDAEGRHAALLEEATTLTRRIMLESAGFLEEALTLAREVDLADRDRIERETALLGLRVAAADGRRHEELDRFNREAERLAAAASRPRLARAASAVARRAAQVFQGVALASLLAAAEGCDSRQVVDPDVGPLDGPRGDADAGPLDHPWVVDPDVRPLDQRPDRPLGGDDMSWPLDARPKDAKLLDAKPPDAKPKDAKPADAKPKDAGPDQMIVDPQPPPDAKAPQARLLDQWRDPAAGHPITRTTDLPLFDPPALGLTARRDGETIEVRAVGVGAAVSTRWEGDGELVGEGLAVRWLPREETDQLRVAVRSQGGVGVAALRARDVRG